MFILEGNQLNYFYFSSKKKIKVKNKIKNRIIKIINYT